MIYIVNEDNAKGIVLQSWGTKYEKLKSKRHKLTLVINGNIEIWSIDDRDYNTLHAVYCDKINRLVEAINNGDKVFYMSF